MEGVARAPRAIQSMVDRAGTPVQAWLDPVGTLAKLAGATDYLNKLRQPGRGVANWLGAQADELESLKEEGLPRSREALAGGAREMVTGGVESGVQSLLTAIPAMATGGTLAPVLAGAGVAGTFGAQQYEQAFKEAKAKGLADADADRYGKKMAAWEAGPEFLGEVATFATLGLGKLFARPIKEAGRKLLATPLKELLRESAPKLAAGLGKAAGIETIEELTTTAGQLYTQAREGMSPDQRGIWDQFISAAPQVLGQTAVATLFHAGGLKALDVTSKRGMARALENPKADPAARIEAAMAVFADANRDNPGKAQAWYWHARDQIRRGKPIDLSKSLDQLTAETATTPPPPATPAPAAPPVVPTPAPAAPPAETPHETAVKSLTADLAKAMGAGQPGAQPVEQTVPERPETIQAQIALTLDAKSAKAATLVPVSYLDAGMPVEPPAGLEVEHVEGKGILFWNPAKVSAEDVQSAIANDALGELLGMGQATKPPGPDDAPG